MSNTIKLTDTQAALLAHFARLADATHTRKTTRSFVPPPGFRLVLPKPGASKSFRVARIEETLTQYSGSESRYVVVVVGPVVNRSGSDHATEDGRRDWRGHDVESLGCPAELAGLLAGPQALAEQEEFLR